VPNVVQNEDLYNSIVLNGKTSPGVVTLSGHDRKREWDIRPGPFLNGAYMVLKWTPPIKFTATFYLVLDQSKGIDDYAAWDAFVPTIKATVQGRTPKAVPIYHPDLAANEITSVVEATIGGMTYDGTGGAYVTVEFQEYRPVKIQGGPPKPTTANDPNAALKAEVQSLTLQYQNTPWG
jgi:hypothetical protein